MGWNELVLGVGEGRRPRCKRGESGGGVAITGEITAEITVEGGGSLSLSLSRARRARKALSPAPRRCSPDATRAW